jgi:hypothetical protein
VTFHDGGFYRRAGGGFYGPVRRRGRPIGGPVPLDTTTGFANFNAAPWSLASLTATDAGSGQTLLTTTATAYCLLYRPGPFGRIRAQVKDGTSTYVFFYSDGGGEKSTYFDLTAGTMLHDDLGGSIINLGGGVFQIDATTNLTGNVGIGLSSVDGTPSGAANGTTATLISVSVYA